MIRRQVALLAVLLPLVLGAESFGQIKPPKFDGPKVERRFSSPIDDVALGGGGRFIILHHPSERKLSVFDVSAGEFVKSIPADDDNVRFAAGIDRLIVILANAGAVNRYTLPTFEPEKPAALPVKVTVDAVHVGYASKGPMLVAGKTEDGKETAFFVNFYTMGQVQYKMPDPKQKTFEFGGRFARVSANNKVFTRWSPEAKPQNAQTLTLDKTTMSIRGSGDSVGHAAPSPDGTRIYTGEGIFANDWRALWHRGPEKPWAIPAIASEEYYASIDTGEFQNKKGPLSISRGGTDALGLPVPLNDIELPGSVSPWGQELFAADRRILFIPEAELLIILPDSNDKLVMHRFDLEDALKKTALKYLVVTSRPPATVRRSTEFTYQLTALSKAAGLTFTLGSGPAGMTVSETGEVRWRVPATGPSIVSAYVHVRNADNQVAIHVIKLTLVDRKPAP